MTSPRNSTEPSEERDIVADLTAENLALRSELAELRAALDASAANAECTKAMQIAVEREAADRRKERAEHTARLDALIRSSSEVRYEINADWSALGTLSGGGFIPDTEAVNANWLEEYIPEEHRERVREEIRRAIAAKDTYNIEHKVNRVDGSVGWALSRAVPLLDENGEITSWMGAASDITDRKTATDLQQVLNDELTHRIKNIFSMVQAIASQTLRGASSLEEGRAAISARLAALSRAQDVLTGETLAGADIREVITAAMVPHEEEAKQMQLDGPPMVLNAQQALGMTLAIHELSTNAIKYGALSNEQGSVAVTWRCQGSSFTFDWIEADGPQVEKPTRRGFGSSLIEQIVPSYFEGEAHLEYDPEGLRFRLTGAVRA
ncbi:HWE histidine kinase domain-containing protein [Donghicola sp.]|uniref:sensor histidine kinase n=1 Tax=Donghicola sp. TaxID=1929294 RepID=UPI0025F4E8AC|nr:HWE histidine kinase domain-containing protein [Donghicola sp.]MCT4579227.1 PAS domain-containing protein [Donghicola sp.]